MVNTYMTYNDKYFLVSDSNEIDKQYDSKKVVLDELVSIAQESLLNTHLQFINSYLTKFQMNDGFTQLNNMLQTYAQQLGLIEQNVGKFKAVPGQVILIESTSIPNGTSPLEYLLTQWEIPRNHQAVMISDTMLRGVLEIDKTQLIPGSNEQQLNESNIPPHMHHSSITDDSNMIKFNGSTNMNIDEQGQRCDMFVNDSVPNLGMDKNELDGSSNVEFKVQSFGAQNPKHTNIPKVHKFYAFKIVNI